MPAETLENPRIVREVWDNESGPRGAGNTAEGLTHSLDLRKEELPMNGTRVCSVEDCAKDARRRGWCTMHYARWRRSGGVQQAGALRYDDDPTGAKRLFEKVRRDGDCLRWTGSHRVEGYAAMIQVSGRKVYPHRLAYEFAKGPIPQGMEVDHLCFVRDCVNPDHLEAVTPDENKRRANLHAAENRDLCPSGHPYSGENLYVRPDGGRKCRICMRESRRKYRDGKANRLGDIDADA